MPLSVIRHVATTSLLLAGVLDAPCSLEAQGASALPKGTLTAPAVVVDGSRSQLQEIWGLAVVTGGRVLALAEMASPALRLVDASTGRRIGAAGRPGEGPGEVRLLSNFGVSGDLIWISDASLDRLSLFDAEGRYQRAVRFPSLTAVPGSSGLPGLDRVVLSILGVRAGGNLLARVIVKYGQPPKWFRRGFVPIVETDPRGRLVRVLAWEKESRAECTVVYPVRGSTRSISVPFCTEDRFAISRNGDYLAVVEQQEATGGNGEFGVTLVGRAGDTVFVRRVAVPATRIPTTTRDSAEQAIRRSLSSQPGGMHSADRRALESLRLPSVYPPIGRVLVGEDGVAWFQLQASGPDRSWIALDTAGRVIGRFTFPQGTHPVTSMGKHVWAVQQDADDVPSVMRYDFR